MLQETARLTARDSQYFRILQLTDFHSDQSEYENERTRDLVRRLVAEHQPELLAVTGDIWCGDNHPDVAPMYMQRDLDFLGALGVPWSFTWGNHDYFGDFKTPMQLIAATPNAIAPWGDGRGNFRLEIARPGVDAPQWEVFFIHSGLRWNMPHDLKWFELESARLRHERGYDVPAVLFFHLPLRNYQVAIDEGRITGAAHEEVLYWGDEEGLGAEIIKSAANVRACFCGHSHRNDCCFEEEGVVFAYGRATGFGGYGGEDLQKGGKLIRLSLDSEEILHETVL